MLDRAVKDRNVSILCAKDCIKANTSKILMLYVDEKQLKSVMSKLKDLNIQSFPQTRKFHQIAIDFTNKIIKFREFSCSDCDCNVACSHYEPEVSHSFAQFYAIILKKSKENSS